MPRVKTSAGPKRGGNETTTKGRGRPRKPEVNNVGSNFTQEKERKSSKPSFGINISAQTVRWRVVQMAWNFKSDMEVAKLLLDCYDVIVSGCLKWSIDIQKNRIPSMVSNDGWKLMEEIDSVMKWKARQPMKKKLLAEWSDGEDEGEGSRGIKVEAENSDTDEYVPEGREEDDDDDGGGGDGQIVKMSPLNKQTGEKEPSNLTMKLLSKAQKYKKRKPKGPTESATKKKQFHYPSKGYTKSGRPKKVLAFLDLPDIPKIFECKQCQVKHTTLEEFKDHFKVHSEYVTVGNTSQHLSVLSNEAIAEIAIIYINCPDCNELTSNYSVHQMKHFKQICDFCGKLFQSYSGWRRHLKYHKAMEAGEKCHVCDKCGKSFFLISALTEHRRLHSKQRPHTCDVCGKGFKQKAHLTRHLYTHSDVKPITCKFCGKGFTNNFNMKSHLRSHTGERPFVCSRCNKSFAHNGSLKTHMKSEHNMESQNVCQSVEEYDDFPIPKLPPGRKKGSTDNVDGKVNERPQAHEKPKMAERGRDVQTLLSIAEGLQQSRAHHIEEMRTVSEEAEQRSDGQQSPVLKALENSNYNKEMREALLSIAAVSDVVDMRISHDNDLSNHSHQSLNVATRSYPQDKHVDSRGHLTTDSAVWHSQAHRLVSNEVPTGETLAHVAHRMMASQSAGHSKSYAAHFQDGIHSGSHPSSRGGKDNPSERGVVAVNPHEVLDLHHVPVTVASEQVIGSSHGNMGSHGNRERGDRDSAAYDTVEIAIPQGLAGQGHGASFTQWHR